MPSQHTGCSAGQLWANADSPSATRQLRQSAGHKRSVLVRHPAFKSTPEELCDGDWHAWFEILSMFPTTVQTRLGEMRAALGERSMMSLQLAAHALKGAAETCCAAKLTEACFSLEGFAATYTGYNGSKTTADVVATDAMASDFDLVVLRYLPLIEQRAALVVENILFLESLQRGGQHIDQLTEAGGFVEHIETGLEEAADPAAALDHATAPAAALSADDPGASWISFQQGDIDALVADLPTTPSAQADQPRQPVEPAMPPGGSTGAKRSNTQLFAEALDKLSFEQMEPRQSGNGIGGRRSGERRSLDASWLIPSPPSPGSQRDGARGRVDGDAASCSDTHSLASAIAPSARSHIAPTTFPNESSRLLREPSLFDAFSKPACISETERADSMSSTQDVDSFFKSALASAGRPSQPRAANKAESIWNAWDGGNRHSRNSFSDAGLINSRGPRLSVSSIRRGARDSQASAGTPGEGGLSCLLKRLTLRASADRHLSASPDKKTTVMIVDDNPLATSILTRGLSARGFSVLSKASVEQALDYLNRPASILPEVMLVDVFFGPTQMTGLELTMELRASGITQSILPIIVMSSHSAKDLVEAAYEAGANDWMSKPVNAHEASARVLEQARMLRIVSAETEARMLQHFLPKAVIRKVKEGSLPFTERVPQATFMFADIVGFTKICDAVDAEVVVNMLHGLISALDEATGRHSVFKVDTVGDCYICSSGCALTEEGQPLVTPARRMLRFAEELLRIVDTMPLMKGWDKPIRMRVGMHTGPVIAAAMGVVSYKFTFIGDTMNTAARMESHGMPGCVHLSEPCFGALLSEGAAADDFVPLGAMDVKGKGQMQTYIAKSAGSRE